MKTDRLKVFVDRLNEEIEHKLDLDYTLSMPKQAQEMSINYQTFFKYTRGTASPNIDNLSKIAKYYDVSTDYLLGLTDCPTTDKDLKFVCEYTGLKSETVDSLKFIQSLGDFSYALSIIDLLVDKIHADLDICACLDSIVEFTRDISTVYLGIGDDDYTEDLIDSLKYKLSKFFNELIDEFAIINSGFTLAEFKNLKSEYQRKRYGTYLFQTE